MLKPIASRLLVEDKTSGQHPLNGAEATIVIVVVVLATALVATGSTTPTAALQLLAGAGLVGVSVLALLGVRPLTLARSGVHIPASQVA
ncbi:hypothetical protein [Streptomyces sp. AA0539]|uniref:hypothetical protein n=1 Tax=Streptomyces sp. AA0539 TaxID=1210045 RepID=UPI00131A1D37|nr:hypothetical protein [Streptomyces sp. AA0539]